MHHVIYLIVFFVIVLGFGYQFLKMPFGDNQQSIVPSATVVPTRDVNQPPKEETYSGEYVCLPHTDTSGPQTMECAFGLKLDDGKYIAIDWGELMTSGAAMEIKSGDRIELTGLFVPVEQLNTDQWRKYPITGILSVKNMTK